LQIGFTKTEFKLKFFKIPEKKDVGRNKAQESAKCDEG
jgi:hypothetical protein